MSESEVLINAFVHGLAAGGMLLISTVVWRSSLNLHVRLAAVLAGASIIAMFVCESPELAEAMRSYFPLDLVAYPVGGLFWLFVLSVFNDMKVTPLTLAPAAVLLASGIAMELAPQPAAGLIWALRNIFAGLLALHAGVLVIRGWGGDLVEGRRRFRALLLSLACLYVLVEVVAGFGYRLGHDARWLTVVIGRPWGGLIVTGLIVALGLLVLQARSAVFGAARRPEPVVDVRSEAADRDLLTRLSGLMAAEGWRREGLTIGDLARELAAPEHRLRRLINQRLGHRNFADFVNGHRIDAAKRRLADPAEARTTVAAIAFDLGYGSLGPFNRAFRAATGATPTEWRRQALGAASPNPSEAA